jgi:hypothetical protein
MRTHTVALEMPCLAVDRNVPRKRVVAPNL